jgi:hypothetical protein
MAWIEPWSEREEARLRKYWSEGKTAAEIARLMDRSRGAIIGKVDRMDLPARESGGKRGAPTETMIDLVADRGFSVRTAADQAGVGRDAANAIFRVFRARYDMNVPRTNFDDFVAGPEKPLRPLEEIDRELAEARR